MKKENKKWGTPKHLLREELEITAPLTDEDRLKRHELGADEWVTEKIVELLKEKRDGRKTTE